MNSPLTIEFIHMMKLKKLEHCAAIAFHDPQAFFECPKVQRPWFFCFFKGLLEVIGGTIQKPLINKLTNFSDVDKAEQLITALKVGG